MAIISISGKINSGKDLIGQIIQYLTSTEYKKIGDVYSYASFLVDIRINNEDSKSEWQIKKFADKLKDIVCLLIGCTREQLEDREFKEKELGEEWWYWKLERDGGYSTILLPYNKSTGIEHFSLTKLTPRLLLQLIGTECGRNIIHPNIWINASFAEYNPVGFDYQGSEGKNIKGDWKYPKWIITDTRFENELKSVKDRGGITIRVNRPQYCPNCPMEDLTSQDCGDCAVYQDEIYQNEHESEIALDNSTFDYTIDNNSDIDSLIEKVKVILTKEKII